MYANLREMHTISRDHPLDLNRDDTGHRDQPIIITLFDIPQVQPVDLHSDREAPCLALLEPFGISEPEIWMVGMARAGRGEGGPCHLASRCLSRCATAHLAWTPRR